MDQFIDQIDDNALVTFNGKYLVDGSKNFRSEEGTKTAFTNMALHTTTTATSALTLLRARNGDSLEIMATDRVTASFVINGRTYVTSFRVGDTETGTIAIFNDIFVALNETARNAGIGNVYGKANFDTPLDIRNAPETEEGRDREPRGATPGAPPDERNVTGTEIQSHIRRRFRDGSIVETGLYNGPILIQNGATIGKNAAGDAVRTADGTTGFTVTATTIGYGYKGGQIAGINISITDSQGNVKKAANAALDAFNLSIREMNISDVFVK